MELAYVQFRGSYIAGNLPRENPVYPRVLYIGAYKKPVDGFRARLGGWFL